MVRRPTRLHPLRCLAVLIFVLVLGGVHPSSAFGRAAAAQAGQNTDLEMLRTRLQQRYDVLPLRDGIALAPRSKSTVRSIEISGGAIAVDGTEVSGSELRQKLGPDADLVLQLSYLDAPSRRALLGLTTPLRAPATEAPAPVQEQPPTRSVRQAGALVRFGSDVTVPAEETVTDDVVVIGGQAHIDGQVDGEVVVVGGSAHLGPHANIRRDVTVVGGTLSRDPGAVIGGRVNEIGFGPSRWTVRRPQGGPLVHGWWPFGGFTPVIRLTGTLLRVALLMMLACVVLLLAQAPVERIAERAAAEPIKAWIIGFLAELVFVPVLIMTVVLLAISIIGIPLLPLVPLAILALCIVFIMGLTGVAHRLGRRVEVGLGRSGGQPYVATILGIALLVSPLILGRMVGLAGGLGFFAAALVGVGVLLEYVGWTVGLGAAALVRFGPPLPVPVAAGTQTAQATTPSEGQ